MIPEAPHIASERSLAAIQLFLAHATGNMRLVSWLGLPLGIAIAGFGIYRILRRLFAGVFAHAHTPGSRHRHASLAEGPETSSWLPLACSVTLILAGLGIAIWALTTFQLSLHQISKEKLGPLLFVTGLGLILGMRHSTDADHVVAISTIVSGQRSIRNAAIIGSVWGLGHTVTIFAVGSMIILFGVEIPPRIGLSMEFSVAIMLVLLGLLNLTGVTQRITAYCTPTAIAGAQLEKPNPVPNAPGTQAHAVGRFGLYQMLRPLVIGLVHGLAGSAAVALLVLSTIRNPYWATAYLLIFGFGTMLGMMCMTAAMAVPMAYAGDRFARLSHHLAMLSGAASLGFGSFLVYQLGFVAGLFTSHPQWTPQ